jgi:phosphatidylglycerophosphate synthase
MTASTDDRRPLRWRDTGGAQAAAAALARLGFTADAVSAMGLVFALLGAAAFLASGSAQGAARSGWLLAAALCIPLRMLANVLDGLVATQHGRSSPHGPIWNELPDRIADILFLVGAGYGAARAGAPGAIALGWLAAVLAVLVSYVFELGRRLGQPPDSCGPGAKPHRMAALTAATVVAASEPLWGGHGQALAVGLALIALLAAITIVRRTLRLAAALERQA